LYSIYAVERIAQDVENDKGVPTIDSSKPRVDKSQSNKVLHVYTRRNLQQKKVQPIIPTLEQMDSIISPYNVPGNNEPHYSYSNSKGVRICARKSARTCSINHPSSKFISYPHWKLAVMNFFLNAL